MGKGDNMTKLDTVGMQERISYIHRVTGLEIKTIKSVLNASYLLDMNSIAEGKRVKAGSYYTMYPDYRKPHAVYSPVDSKMVNVDGHYLLKVNPLKNMKEALDILKDNTNTKDSMEP